MYDCLYSQLVKDSYCSYCWRIPKMPTKIGIHISLIVFKRISFKSPQCFMFGLLYSVYTVIVSIIRNLWTYPNFALKIFHKKKLKFNLHNPRLLKFDIRNRIRFIVCVYQTTHILVTEDLMLSIQIFQDPLDLSTFFSQYSQ